MNKKKIALIIIFIVLIITIVILAHLGSKKSDEISNNNSSEQRINDINKVMTSYLGSNWPYVCLGIAIIFFILLIVLVLFRKEKYKSLWKYCKKNRDNSTYYNFNNNNRSYCIIN